MNLVGFKWLKSIMLEILSKGVINCNWKANFYFKGCDKFQFNPGLLTLQINTITPSNGRRSIN